MPDLKVIKLPPREPDVDNSGVSSMLRRLADDIDKETAQLSGAGVVMAYADGAVGSMWIGDYHLDLLKALTVLRLRLERECD